MDKLRVVIIGAGYVAQHHLAALQRMPQEVEVVAIVDRDLATAGLLAKRFGVARTAASLAEVRDTAPTAAYVLTPPGSHCAIALEALAMGCHVLVEKPMAETVEDCDRMIEAARAAGRTLSVNHSDRLDPVVEDALARVRSGAIGEVVCVDFLRSSDYPPYPGGPLPALSRKGSYPFQDLGVHGLYLLEAFLGPVKHCDIRWRSLRGDLHLQFDEWWTQAECANGVGRLQISWNVRPLQSRLIIQGTRGVIEVDRFLQTVRVQKVWPGPKFLSNFANAMTNGAAQAVAAPWNLGRFVVGALRPSPGIQRGAELFARAVIAGTPPPVPPEEARRALAAMREACERADAERNAVLAARLRPPAPADIVVTGAGGFLGTALLKRVADGTRRVRALVRRLPKAPLAGVDYVVGDLGDPEFVGVALRDARLVYHVGAAMRGSGADFQAGTVWGTRNVVDACLAHGVDRLVYVSSMSVLDHAGRRAGEVVDEGYRLEPRPGARGFYTQTKLEAENGVMAAIRDRGLRAVVVRPGQIFGPGAEAVTPNGVVGLAGRWLVIGLDDPLLPLVYIDDVIDGLVATAASDAALGRIVHLVDEVPVRRSEYLAVARQHPAVPRQVRVPKLVFKGLALGVELLGKVLKRDVPLTRYRVNSLQPLAGLDGTLARTLLGWKAAVGSRDGLRRMFAQR